MYVQYQKADFVFYLTPFSLIGLSRVSRRDSNFRPKKTIPTGARLFAHASLHVNEISMEISNGAILRNWERIVRVPSRELGNLWMIRSLSY